MRGAAGFWRSREEDRPFRFRTFLCIFLSGAGVLGALLAVFLYNELHAERTILAARELTAVRQGKRAIDQAFGLVTSDLFFFAESPSLQNFVADDSLASRETLAAAFLALMRNKRFYQRICYCADSGRAVVGVEAGNGAPVVMATAAERPGDHCQDVSRVLGRDDFFVSAVPLGAGGGECAGLLAAYPPFLCPGL